MRRFYCRCGGEIFFHDHYCKACGRDLAYDSHIKTMWSGEDNQNGVFIAHSPQGRKLTFKTCHNRHTVVACNWVLPSKSEECQCVSCRSTRTIPDQTLTKNTERWRKLEKSKRLLFQTLIELDLINGKRPESISDLQFDFLEDNRSNPAVNLEHILTGHCDGLITLNAAEADEGFLHTMKEQMQERYRTLLGHFRHEIGHYFWLKLFVTEPQKEAFRNVFGDEREDYAQALENYYAKGKQNHWRSRFITPYAASHPHEDWAETWAHYMHIVDTLQTAQSYNLSVYQPQEHNFDNWFAEWARVAQVMNQLNRSMGTAAPYPFKLSEMVVGKLRFIDEVVQQYAKQNASAQQQKAGQADE